MILISLPGWILLAASLAGTLYTLAAAFTLLRFLAAMGTPARRQEAVTILKPLYGAEPRLRDNLASFLNQQHDGPVQLLCGIQRRDDPAIAVVEQLRAEFPQARIDLVVDATSHGANGKVANLINLEPHIAHDHIVLSDSDIAVLPDYLARLLATLDTPGTGAVTAAYYGRGDAGFWSKVAAAGTSWQFLPGIVFGTRYGLARPCMGSTIALRRDTLAAIGGFRAFAAILADDYAMGEAIAARGLRVVVARLLVAHASIETKLADLWQHELRWGATVFALTPAAYVAAVIAIPLPLALLGALWQPQAGLVATCLAVLARLVAARSADACAGERSAPLWVLPLRDGLTFALFVASLFARRVDWRGATLTMEQHGQISAGPETPIR